MISLMPRFVALALLVGLAAPVAAELPVGAPAPAFSTPGAQSGKAFTFVLRRALRKGPVVLYFYPKSFTQGCTLEAHGFAEAIAEFRQAGASVIGLSADTLATQLKFSREACRDRFPVGIATPAIIAAYQVDLRGDDGASTGLSSRTSYVIARNGRIVMVHSDRDYRDHVRRTLAAVKAIKAKAQR
jgi:peroxiredoxin